MNINILAVRLSTIFIYFSLILHFSSCLVYMYACPRNKCSSNHWIVSREFLFNDVSMFLQCFHDRSYWRNEVFEAVPMQFVLRDVHRHFYSDWRLVSTFFGRHHIDELRYYKLQVFRRIFRWRYVSYCSKLLFYVDFLRLRNEEAHGSYFQ